MPQPSISDVHIDQPLSQISIAYMQAASNFIATRVFPWVKVSKQSDKYYIFDKNAWMRDQVQLRAPGDESAGSGYTLSNTTYYADVWALHKDIDDQTRANSDAPLDPDRNATNWLTLQMLIRREREFAASAFATGKWGTDKTVTNQWNDQSSSTPIEDVEVGKGTILTNTGFLPNKLVLGYNTYKHLRNHPDLVDRIKYSGQKVVSLADMAQLFDVEEVLVSKAAYASNVENETAAYAFAMGNHALLVYTTPTPGLEVPSGGYFFGWDQMSAGSSGMDSFVKKFRIEPKASDRVEIQSAWDTAITASDMGYFFSSVVSS